MIDTGRSSDAASSAGAPAESSAFPLRHLSEVVLTL